VYQYYDVRNSEQWRPCEQLDWVRNMWLRIICRCAVHACCIVAKGWHSGLSHPIPRGITSYGPPHGSTFCAAPPGRQVLLFNNMMHQDYSQLLLYSSWILFWSNLLNLKTTGPLSSHLKPLKPAHYSGSWRNPASAWIGDCLIGSPGNLDQNPADAPT
jgi:hypothetical protein